MAALRQCFHGRKFIYYPDGEILKQYQINRERYHQDNNDTLISNIYDKKFHMIFGYVKYIYQGKKLIKKIKSGQHH